MFRILDSMAQLALRFISGKYQGGEFPLADGSPVIVGRSSDLDMVLVEEMVSRKHARIELRGGVVHVEDMGSTNGTFVNGERIDRASLVEGDRLLIGTSILKLVLLEEPPSSKRSLQSVAFGKETVRQQVTPSATGGSARMTGNLEEIPLPDLMQLFGTSRKTGTLVLHATAGTSKGKIGRIHLLDGLVVFASIEGGPSLPPLKAAYRMLGWMEGTFALEPHDATVSATLGLTAQAYLMEGFRQLDEFAQVSSRAPQQNQRLGLRTPLEAPLHTLEQTELEVLQACINSPDLATALDRSPKTDFETVKDVVDLIKRGYLAVVK